MKIAAVAVVFSTLVLAVFANVSRADAIESAATTTTSLPDNGLLLVSTIDGFLTAVDVQSGALKWKFKEDPVVHSSRELQTGFVFLPSPRDGQLYVLEDGGLGKLPFTIPQLVKASPSRTTDGIFYAGSKKDVWISINPETGSRMETLPPPAANSFCPISHPETVFIGKTEYKLSVLDTKNKDRQWNATFIDYSSHLLPAESGYPLQHFTNDGKIATFDRDSGKLLWMRDYQGVIVNLYLMKTDGLHLLPSQAVGINLFEEMTADEDAPDLSWFDTVPQGRFPSNSYNEEIEIISNGKLKNALFVGESANGLFAIPIIVDNDSNSFPKILGPMLMDGPPPNSVNANVDGSIARRPQLPRKVPLTMTTYKTVDGEYLLLGFHTYPQLVMKYTLDVTDPTNLPRYVNPYPYLEYQMDSNPFPRKCIGKNCKKSQKQKLLPAKSNQLQIEQDPIDEDDRTFIEMLNEFYEKYPYQTFGFVTTITALLFATVYMFGRASVSHHSIPSRETSHASQRSRAYSTEQSRKTWSQILFRTSSKNSEIVQEEEEDINLAIGWKKIGKIEYDTNAILGNGCEGTIVYKGRFDGREAAVKRVITEIVSFVDREINLLRQSDSHPNVIRYFCSESDGTFRFIALELCDCSLREYVMNHETQRRYSDVPKVDIMRQATEGLAYLHQNSIVHRDIKPENILLTRDTRGKIRVLISDFGLCKQIRAGHASISRMSGLAGTDGWIAPEAYIDGASITCLADVFSLGCLYFYILTDGKHPFGEKTTRQGNILKGEYNLAALTQRDTSFNIAALNLVENMIQLKPKIRPRLTVVLSHPMFWTNEKILQFFMDVSDRIEPKNEEGSEVVERLERCGTRVTKNFIGVIDDLLKADLKQRRSYKGDSIRDLLRALRNKKHHYHEIPQEVRQQVGEIPNGYTQYWTSKFPRLLMHVYNAMICCAEESVFATYYPMEAHSFCNRRLEEELDSDFIIAGQGFNLKHTMSTPALPGSPGKIQREGTPENWRNQGPISANAAKKRKKKKRAPISVLSTTDELDQDRKQDDDIKEESPE